MKLLLGAVLLRAGTSLAQQGPAEPPVVKFEAEGIRLLDAVRLTLRHDPDIKLQVADASLQEGVAQEQRGFFDLSLTADVFYEDREQELRESRKDIEFQKRKDLDDAIALGNRFAGDARALLDALRRAQAGAPGQENVPDSVIQAQLVFVSALINQITDPQTRQDLLALRQRILTDNINKTTANIQQALQSLADAQDRRRRLGDVPIDEFFKQGRLRFSFEKPFRNGLFVSPYFEGRYDATNFKGKEKDAMFGGKGIEDLYSFRAGADAVLPLLQGRGAVSTAAFERAAESARAASLQFVDHQAALSALRTIRAYWTVRAAEETVQITARSVELQARLVQASRALIAGDELPQSELSRVLASEARSKARLEGAERDLLDARVGLAKAMGVAITDAPETLPRARDSFPAVPDELPAEAEQEGLVRDAMTRRQDLLGSVGLEEAGEILARGARADLRPTLDLDFGSWFTALGEKSAGAALDRWVGPSVKVGLSFEKPLGNNVFHGRLVQRDAEYRRSQIGTLDLERTIRLGIVRTSRTLEQSRDRVRQAEVAVGHYRRLVEAEIDRFRTGDSTLVDAILTEDQQTDALLAFVFAQRDLATLVAELRFESGLLVLPGRGDRAVVQENLITVPRLMPRSGR